MTKHEIYVEAAKPRGRTIDLYLNVAFFGDAPDIPDFARWLMPHSCYLVDTLEEADLVIFGGGDDVDPALYGETHHSSTYINPARDEEEIMYYEEARAIGIPILGICRGAQLGHVMEGGKLYQDVDNHNEGWHCAYDPFGCQFLADISSVHHQSCRPREDDRMKIILESWESTYRWASADEKRPAKGSKEQDIEAFFYRDACLLGIQGHPEYGGFTEYSDWAIKKIEDLFLNSPDTEFRGGRLRVKQDRIQQLEPLLEV